MNVVTTSVTGVLNMKEKCVKPNQLPSSANFKMVKLTFYFVIVQFLFKFAQGQGPGFNKFFNVSENQPPGTQVGYVSSSLSYTYTTDDTLFQNYFNLDENTGRITTKVEIDRESLSDLRDNEFSLLVIARSTTDGNHPVEVHIEVIDVNDNHPKFPNDVSRLRIRENSRIGSMFRIDTATDLDYQNNALINTYRILSGEGPFSLVFNPDLYGQVLFLNTTGDINREEISQYTLIIQAKDSGSPTQLSGTTTLSIDVDDQNDNSPVFDPSNYYASVNETDDVGTLVRRVHATDKDIGENQRITYEFHNPNEATAQFVISRDTGEIRTAVKPLVCPNGQCDLSIVARDNGTPSYLGRAFVYVTVIDTNNHDPEITVKYVPTDSTEYSSVNEDSVNGEIVAGITVTDQDDGINGETIARIIAGNELRHFLFEAYDSQKYTIRVNGDGVLDRERYHVYNLTVEARDRGNPPRIATKEVVIYVNDINDFPPVFVNKRVVLSISEITEVGSFIASMHATDKDTGINAKLTYKIETGNNPNWFHIDTDTGLITTKTKLHYEIANRFTMNISVHDGAINPFWDYASLQVTIWDENDMPPTFASTTFNEELDENLGSVSPVVLATAQDNDSGLNGTLVYQFHPHVELMYPNTFHLDQSTGAVTTNKALDREVISDYIIKVIAKDKGPAPLTSTATVFLKVKDLNDNPPVFYPSQYFANVYEGQPQGLEITKVIATDIDEGENAEIMYSFFVSNSKFSIDSNSGIITTTATLRKDQGSSYILNVVARGKFMKYSDSATVQVSVLSVSDQQPIFNRANYSFTNIPEDHGTDGAPTYVGSQIGQVTANSGSIGTVTNYFIVDGNLDNTFSIDGTGYIRREKAIDREKHPEFVLKVVAEAGTQFAETYVHITVKDSNDNAPEFEYPKIEVDLIENWPVGHYITVFSAKDADAPGPNSQVSYSLQTDQNGVFAFQADTGVLYLNKPMERLASKMVTLVVVASDAGSPKYSSTQQVTLTVKDINNKTPRFADTKLEKSLIESHPVNSRFLNVEAVDNDEGDNGRLTYNITRGNEDKAFGIFPDGNLYIAKTLDREVKNLYKLSVVAHDHGTPQRSSECNITIHITDDNDNKPIFLNATYLFSVPENRRSGSYIGRVMASDADMGRNSDLTYYFQHHQQTNFRIDSQTGEIYSLVTFDREQYAKSEYAIVFDVVARDNGLNQLEDVATVRVTILDVNDNAPVFKQPIYTVSVFENAPTYSNVTVVKADDLDSFENSIVTYAILSGNEDGIFIMNQFTGQISLNQQLDRENEDYYELTVLATDSGKDIQFNDTCVVQITVKDINDNFPMFAQTQLDSSVREDEKPGYILGHFTATDTDLGVNAEITYTLSGLDNDGSFGIDAHTGKIYLLKKLDYEKKKLYRLNVTATDNGVPQLPYYVRFSITVEDVNDNAPFFQNEPIACSITEHSTGSVCTVHAEDADSDKNGEVLYNIVYQDPPGDQFKIVKSSGQVYIDKEIDRESTDLFTLRVSALDQASDESKRLTSETTVTISVNDINDNNPQITSFNAIAVPLSTSANTFITTIKATDEDAGENGRVALQLLQSSGNTFSIESASGRFLLNRQLPDNPLKYPVTIQAHDYGPSQRTIQYPLTVIVTNNNNQGPVFQDTPYTGSIYENDGSSTILTVKAASRHGSAVQYYVTNITQNGAQVGRYFVINMDSGVLKPNGPLDHEEIGESFDVEIYAMDTDGSTPRTSFILAKVTVMDINDTPPRFTKSFFEFDVDENVQQGFPIGKLQVYDEDDLGGLSLSFVNTPDNKLQIRPDGTISTSGTLDRETIARYTLNVTANDGLQTSHCMVRINVNDVNDNAPKFDQSFYSFDIPEDTAIGTTVGSVRADDFDVGLNGDVLYSLTAGWGNDTFELDPVKGTFKLLRVLDFEENSLYTLQVLAYDAGTEPQTSSILVFFNVKDTNDHIPEFEQGEYNAAVYENVTIGTSVLQVEALDIDSGENGQVTYKLLSGDTQGQFQVDPDTGVINVISALDREVMPNYTLVVMAMDRGTFWETRPSATAKVLISLLDINDYTPEFLTPSVIGVRENTQTGTVVHTVKVRDLDIGANSDLTFGVSSNTGSVPFSLGVSDGKLRVSADLDRELVANYSMIITVQDKGRPPLMATQSLFINIEDENDHDPVFTPEFYEGSVSEDVMIGTTLLQVNATDLDFGLNGIVKYYVLSGDENFDFSLDQSSGVLRVQKNLDYERVSEYKLIVQAEDSGDNTRFSTATVSITIVDFNDNTPIFLNSPYMAYVRENMDRPVRVLQVSAIDQDSPPFNQLQYKIQAGDRSLFNISETTGEIMALQKLDREQRESYILTVVATDSGNGRGLTGSGTVTIFVEDMNDNAPEFDQTGMYLAHVQENQVAHTSVIIVTATDKDEGVNAHIVYSLKDDAGGKFTVSPNSGRIETLVTLNREEVDEYTLEVIAMDTSLLPLTATATLRVYVDDENDNPPAFEKERYERDVPLPASSGTFILGTTASDIDVGENRLLTYSLTGQDASSFGIDPRTGVITASRTLIEKTYSFMVKATDKGSNPLSSSVPVTVTMTSSQTITPPTFGSVPTDISIVENLNPNSTITTVTAQSSNGAAVTLSIAGGNIGDAFAIDAKSGRIYVKNVVDYELLSEYHLWVEARQNGSPPVSGYKEVVVRIEDLNDNRPIFTQTLYEVDIKENSPFSTSLVAVTAVDADSGANSELQYAIIGDDAAFFRISSSTGLIVTIDKLDRETVDSYSFVVTATDKGAQPMSSTTSVRIQVLDENDERPSFTKQFRVKIPENMEVGSFVLRVTSSDGDIGANAIASYSLTDDANGTFTIDGPSGNITLRKSLDAEMIKSYQLRVSANDRAHDVHGNVQVDIMDVNDNSPVIIPPFSFSFTEQMPIDSVIGKLRASDSDISSPNNVTYFSLKLASSYFHLDSDTGILTSAEELTFDPMYDLTEPPNRHELIVIARDLGTPARSSERLIYVNVMDYNDHRPEFSETSYRNAVPEGTPVGNSVVTVHAVDEHDYGINAEVEYDIVSGNGTQLFSIDRVSGIVSVKSSLSGHKNKEYQVVVKAEDKGLAPLSSTVPVNLVVTDVNVHAPVFIAPVSRQITIPESKKVGTLIETFRAEDSDYGLNAEIEFFITAGNDDDLFSMNKASGDLSVKNELDYEVETDYQLTVTAKDKALHPKDKSITYLVKLQDVNDNDPVFGRSSDTVFIEENSPRGVSVYQALAVDADSGENAVIQYAIVEGNGQNKFLIDSSTGLVTTSGDLDYETEEKYTLMIMASNNAPGHKSTMTLNIAIDGVNEYVPRFTKDVYYFSVSESADVSTPIGRVRAEDNDAGPDGIVNYFLIGDSNAKGFKVDPRTGDILVSGQPDYESSPKITLRVLAKNWGSVRGNDTDICEVQINVQDANDPPKFSQNIYQAYIREDTTRADVSVVKVQAVDSDFDAADKTFTYTILAGNVKNMFKIGPSTGIVTTTGNIALDRETVAVYNVTVGAVDTGSPPETGSATVSINIEDVNDNGPFFTNFTASVREGQAPGTMVTTLTQFTDDLDGTGNKGPYSYSNKPGSHIAYQFFTIESNGVVKTKAVLDRESANSEFAVPVVVSDSGQPRQTSTLTFKVIILDENDSPPKPRYLDIYLSVYEGQLPSGPIANIRPLDDDSTGSYSCSLAGANNPFMFSIVDGCNLKMSQIPSDPEYTISVESTDGIHESVTYDVVVKVSTFGNTTLEHSTVIQIADTTPENFIQHLYSDFLSALKSVFEPQDKINIFGLSGHSSGVLVNIAASYGIDEYFKKSELVQKLSSGKSRIEKDIGKYIASLDFSGCQESQCKNSGQCASHVTVQGTNQIADSPYQVFSSPTLKLTTYCVCQPEYTGPDCSQQATPCGNIYCQNGATCVTNGNVPTCSCPETWTGNRCDQDINECASPGFCKNGGTCQNTLGGFTCECVDGYFGKQCQDGENFCKTSPCVHGTCENQPEGYVCLCNYGYFGLTCDKSSIGFFETSYMEYPAVTSLSSMEIVFATEKANALVMYNPSQASSKFLAVQILKGQLEVAANVGSGSTVRLSVSTLVNTGKWFQARIVVNSQTVRVWVDRCPENLVGCEECQTGSNCYNQTHIPGQWSLGRNDHPLLIGGVKNMDTILDRLGQVSSHDFIGCMQTVTINDVELLGETSLSDAGIERACPRSEAGDVCAGYTCANGGACVSEWTGAVCHCTPGFMGTHCEEALKPIGFSPATYISIKMRETARRDALLVDGSRRRRATTSSSLMLRFRTTQTNGMLMFASAEGNRFCVLSVFDGSVKFTVTQYGGSKSVITPNINVSDGEWHNVTVSLNGKDATLSLDGTQSQTSALDPFLFNYPKVQNFTIGGAPSTVTIDNQNFKDFQGCISVFKLDGEQLPMIGETEKYKIVATAGYENGCSDMCTNNVCNGNGCTIEGEAIVCAPPPGGGPALSIGIIIMIVFFVVLLIVIVIVFIVFRKRGQQCLKRKQLSAGAPAKSANSSGHSNPDSGYGENNIDELIIRNHVAQELAHSNYSRQLNGHLVKPDIIKSEVNRTAMPLEMEDGTVIIDNASDVTHLRDLNGEVLEHYDIENASSIAPSDIDVVDHYRHFHDGKQRRKNKAHSDHSQSKHSSRHYNNNSNHSNHSYHSHGMRDSPNLVSSVPFMNDLARNSPSARHSPMMNQLSRNSPNVQPSPLTVNIHGHHMPVTDLNGGSRTTSEHSLASHRSKTSNSTPNKPKRQMLPNGNLNSNKVLNHNYENGKFLTKEEVDRLNARPRESPASLMEAFSTSSENNTRKMQKPFEQYQDTSVLLEPPDSSSDDSANDSFTCSEFEYENDKPRNDFDPTNRIFSKIKEETEHEDGAYHNKNFKVDGLDSGGNSFSSNERSSDDNQGQSKAINSAFNWDDLLNWGPKFEKLVGVFTDIALLPDAENVDFAEAEAKSVDREEYV